MGFFTDAYDLFIIGVASTLLAKQWHLSATQTGLINSMTLLGAFLGACVLGRLADLLGRKRIAVFDASVMVGVYLFPQISQAFGLAGALKFAAGMALVGTLLTLVLPEPSRRSLEDISDEGRSRGELQHLVPVEAQAEMA